MAKRRPDGDGLIRKRVDGRWEGRVVIDYDEKGLPKTKNVLGKTKAECLEKLKKLQDEVMPPIRRCSEEMPFGEWMDFWYQTYCKPGLNRNTQLGYEDRIYKHIIPQLGKIPLNKLTRNDLQKFYAHLKTNGRLIRVEQYGPGLVRSDGAGVPCQLPGGSGSGGDRGVAPGEPGGGVQTAA